MRDVREEDRKRRSGGIQEKEKKGRREQVREYTEDGKEYRRERQEEGGREGERKKERKREKRILTVESIPERSSGIQKLG